MLLTRKLKRTQAEIVATMRGMYPAMSKAAISLAERTGESGVQFSAKFKNDVFAAFGCKKPKAKRKNPKSVTIWLSDAQNRWLAEEAARLGCCKADVMRALIREKIKENAACGDGAPADRTEKECV